MTRNIKNLKPNPNSRFEQGYIDPNQCEKLYESVRNEPIIYRSSLEKKFIKWCENSKSVKKWGSECVQIPYLDSKGKSHIYNTDFTVDLENGLRLVVEVKPYNQTIKPKGKPCDNWQWNTYIKNRQKWNAAMKHCRRNKCRFIIVTEKVIDNFK